MTSPFGRLVLVVDPAADRGRVRGELPAIERLLADRGLDHRRVEAPSGEATEASRQALAAGDRFLVAVGNDPLVNEVANAILPPGSSNETGGRPILGLIPMGEPRDLALTFGLPLDPPRAVGHLDGSGTYAIDAARVTCRGPDGVDGGRFFLNAAEVGLGAAVLARTDNLPMTLGRSRRFLGFWSAFATFRPSAVTLTGDRRTWEGSMNNLIVANGQYLGDGYRWSPRSWPSDGYLDVLVMTGPRSDAFTLLQKAALGEHLPNPHIVEYKSRRLEVTSARSLAVHADGVVLGATPATFEVLPEAVLLKI